MDKLFELLFHAGGLVQFATFIVPGFVAWRTYQWRRPQGEQKPTDAIAGIVTFSVVNSLFWFWHTWTVWPQTSLQAVAFAVEAFATPIVLALMYQSLIEYAARRSWITSPHPRAWDFLCNSLANRKNALAREGLFLIVTLKGGAKVAGTYASPGFASLWPYDRDLLLGQVWELEDGKPVRQVAGSIGLYMNENEVSMIEVVDYGSMVHLLETTEDDDAET